LTWKSKKIILGDEELLPKGARQIPFKDTDKEEYL
jgi:hypothetical protein